ncbi:MAG: hypothetical protein Q7S45_02335 [Candidatus Curtissbacteria bacterium]|nr:hypothetical protein [Candidatus Curtissbacteria bacterium]
MDREFVRSALLFLTLPTAAVFACNTEPKSEFKAPFPPQVTTPVERSYDIALDKKTIIKKAKEAGIGIVFFGIRDVDGSLSGSDILVKVSRIEKDGRKTDTDNFKINLGVGTTYAALATPSCFGEYQISVSIDSGRSYTVLPIPDLKTRISYQTFRLFEETCSRDINVELGPN